MEIITATTIFLASLNVYGECGFAYNAETSEDGIVTAKTVYRKSVCGKYLSPTLKYNYVYDGEQRLAQKEVLKWNGVTGEWDKSHILNYMYDENGYAIGKDITNVERFRKRGVVYMTLCHNGNNDICGSARYNDENLGVSQFGEAVIREMNRTGMMIDLSHSGERSFYETLEISQMPVVCSHSSCRSLCDHPRNLTDDQIKAITRKGGVIQVCLYSGFLRSDREANILDAIEHLNHIVNLAGVEHVGIGTDFDGDGGIIGCNDSSELINFTRRLMKERYSEEDIRRIWGGNFLRVMEEVQKHSSL